MNKISSNANTDRSFYIKDTIVSFEEDETHEFKGHRNISVEEIPPWCRIAGSNRRSRKAVSRNINAFLNSARGGTVYLGIVDEGIVKGLQLTEHQKHHVIIAMTDLAARYKPPIQSDMYSIKFCPVLRREQLTVQTFEHVFDEAKQTPHVIRTSDYCWCDREAEFRCRRNISIQEYVIEITVFPFRDELTRDKSGHYKLKLHPIYEDELGRCYFRRTASIVRCSRNEIVEFTRQEVQSRFTSIVSALKEEIVCLEKEMANL